MVANEKNPSEAKKKAVEEQKKVIVYSPKGKPFWDLLRKQTPRRWLASPIPYFEP